MEWTKQDVLDAARLLAVLEQRSERKVREAAVRLENCTAQIQYGGHAATMAVAAISFEDNGCARPTPDEAIDDRSRRNRRSGGL